MHPGEKFEASEGRQLEEVTVLLRDGYESLRQLIKKLKVDSIYNPPTVMWKHTHGSHRSIFLQS